MKKTLLSLSLFFALSAIAFAGLPDTIRPVKNIILMIPDGTSIASVSLARLYQRYLNPEFRHLNVDPYICGNVVTYSSDAPIGDSAPTTSCYMTGVVSQSGFVATYPPATDHDIVAVDKDMAYRPAVTLLEAAKWVLGKKVGLVVTCEYPHATPADCSAHSYSRKRYDWISPQMVNLPLDVMFGGGTSIINDADKQDLARQGIAYYADDIASFRSQTNTPVWALFAPKEQPFDIDRDPAKVPSIAEMTTKALELLSKNNDKGFFLMIEGSKVDWAAHSNDPIGIVSEMVAFDKAVAEAIAFAQKDGNTAVFIVPDHSTGGITIGREDLPKYDKASIEQLIGGIAKIKVSADGMAELLNKADKDRARELFLQKASITLSDEELDMLYNCTEYVHSPIDKKIRKGSQSQALYSGKLARVVTAIYNAHLFIGFTTYGHTGEEVFMASYHPQGDRPVGVIQNYDVNKYLGKLFGIEGLLPQLTNDYFAPLTEVLPGKHFRYVGKKDLPSLIEVEWDENHLLHLYPFTKKMVWGTRKQIKQNKGKVLYAPNCSVWVDKNEMLYLNRKVKQMLDEIK